MISPQLKRLRETFDLDAAQAKLIKQLCAARDSAEKLAHIIENHCPDTAAYAGGCHRSPYHSQMWRTTLVLHAIDCILGTHGVEALDPDGVYCVHPPAYEYCNTGDTYATTLIYKRETDRLFVGCWGAIAERFPTEEE